MTCSCKPPTSRELLERVQNTAEDLSTATVAIDRARSEFSRREFDYAEARRALRNHHDAIEARLRRAEGALRAVADLCSETMRTMSDVDAPSSDVVAFAERVSALLPKDGAR